MFKKIIIIFLVFACVVNYAYALFQEKEIYSECDCRYGASHSEIDGSWGCHCQKVGGSCICWLCENPEP